MNNEEIYSMAFTGCIGGATERAISSTSQATYTDFVLAARAFAIAVDAAIPPREETVDQESDLMLAICQGYWSTRFPQSQDSSSYAEEAGAIAALFNEADEHIFG